MNDNHMCSSEPDLQQLKMFFVLAQVGSYTETAKRMFRTQSAVSHAIRKLEDSVGAKLVAQKGRTFSLTEEGRRLLEASETAFYAIESACESIASTGGESLGRIRVGATVEFGCNVLTRHMATFTQTYPNVKIELQMHRELLSLLLKDDLDLVVDCKEHTLPELQQDVLFRESYVVACSPAYKEKTDPRKPADLSECTVISIDPEGTWWNRFLLSFSPQKRPRLSNIMTISHIRAAIVAAMNHMGVILVPRYSILSLLESGELVSLFPDIRILEDRFSLYQKRARAKLERNQLLTEFLKSMKPSEFG